MASSDINPRLTEFVAFLIRDPSQQNFLELGDILSRIFPTHSHSSKRRARLAALRSNFLSNNLSREKLQWLPEYLLDMVPRTPRDHSSSAEDRNNPDVSEHNAPTTSPSRPVTPTTSGRVRASDGHQRVEPQPDNHDQTDNDIHAPLSEYPRGRQPGSMSSRHEPVLVPHRGHPHATLPLQLDDHTAAHSGSGPPRSRISLMEPHVAVNLPTAYRTNTPVALAPPPAPPSTAASSARQGGFRYTPNAGPSPSYLAALALNRGHTTTLTSSGGSATSSEPLPTPNSSRSGHGLPWVYARPGSTQSSGRPVSGVAERASCDISTPGNGFRFAAPLTSADYSESMPPPPPPPPRGATTHARPHNTSTVSSFTPHMPTPQDPTAATSLSGTATMYRDDVLPLHGQGTGLLDDDYGPDADEGSDEEGSGGEGQDLGGPGVTVVGTTRKGRVPRAGGQPDVSDERHAAILADPPRNFTMAETQELAEYFFEPRADRRRSATAELPGSAHMPIFKELSRTKFGNSRSPSTLRTQYKNMRDTFQDLIEFAKHFSLDFTGYRDEDELLQLLRHQLDQLDAQGIKLPHLSPWKILVFVRKHWYHWMRASIGDHPNMQTSTEFYDGVVSPPPPAPPELPPPVTQPSTLSRSHAPSSHSRTPSSHSRAPSSHSRAPSSHSRAPSSHSRAPSSHSRAPSSHSRTPSHAATRPRAPTQSSMSLRLDVQPPAQPQAPPPPTTGSSRGGNKGKIRAQPPNAPPGNPAIHAPASQIPPAPSSSTSVPRTTSATSSSSLLRIPRDSASARQARRAVPTGGSVSTRLSRHSRASGQGHGTTPFPTGISSSTRSRTTGSSFDPEVSGGEIIRQERRFLDEELEVSRADSEHDRLFRQIQIQIAQQMARLNTRAAMQTMRLEREGAALGRVTARVQHAAARTSMMANAATTIGPQHPDHLQTSGQVAQPSGLGTFEDMLMEARQEVDEEMGPIDDDEDEDEDEELPSTLPQTRIFTRGLLAAASYPRTSFPPQRAGPSNYQNQLHDTASMSSRFEDMGTVVGSPREGAGEDLMEVESLSIGGTNYEEDEDLEYVDLPPQPPR